MIRPYHVQRAGRLYNICTRCGRPVYAGHVHHVCEPACMAVTLPVPLNQRAGNIQWIADMYARWSAQLAWETLGEMRP